MQNLKNSSVVHYIYYLRDVNGDVAYVGKSWNPVRRLNDARKRYSEMFTLELGKSFKNILNACKSERKEIQRLRPRLNKRITSSPSSFGMKFTKPKEVCEKIRRSKLGIKRPPFSEEWRINLSKSHVGNTALLGFKFTKESRRKMSEARTGIPRGPYRTKNSDRQQLLQSGYGHPWRLQGLSKELQESIG